MKKILLTGVNGQVGHAIQQLAAQTDNDLAIIALSRAQLDLADVDAIRQIMQSMKPDIIVNPAAYTAVDKAESEPDLAFAINATAPQIIAEEAAKLGASLIHFSTDYVYDGRKETAYQETDAVNPLSIYGKSKLAGEEAIRRVGLPHLILRTSWVYGAYGKNFLKTILRLSAQHDHLRIVADQFGSPTSSNSIAQGLLQLLRAWQPSAEQQSGTYHITNGGSGSWHRFACQIIRDYEDIQELHNLPVLKARVDDVEAIPTKDYPTPAFRPANSRLDNTKLKQTFGVELPLWQDALKEVINQVVEMDDITEPTFNNTKGDSKPINKQLSGCSGD
jgi:dTDP-4-dehydrorhamnose reductase